MESESLYRVLPLHHNPQCMHYTPGAPGTLNFGSLYNHLITKEVIRFSNGSGLNILKPQCNKK
jgi:hypothetical protein